MPINNINQNFNLFYYYRENYYYNTYNNNFSLPNIHYIHLPYYMTFDDDNKNSKTTIMEIE